MRYARSSNSPKRNGLPVPSGTRELGHLESRSHTRRSTRAQHVEALGPSAARVAELRAYFFPCLRHSESCASESKGVERSGLIRSNDDLTVVAILPNDPAQKSARWGERTHFPSVRCIASDKLDCPRMAPARLRLDGWAGAKPTASPEHAAVVAWSRLSNALVLRKHT